MRVLITGGFGFIGSHVAERYFKEGYDVFIIDNLSSGKKENVTIKNKNYHLSVQDPKCEEIFKSYRFDVVIHLAAQVSVQKSIQNPIEDMDINLVGLVNMLNLSNKYGVKKFLFASSAAVYGATEELPIKEDAYLNPISPYGISKWMGETYCKKWDELYGFTSICFRFSNVYGPRQSSEGEGGVVSTFLRKVLDEKPIEIHGDGKQTRDFIFVKDVADALYRASNTDLLEGVYNLSTNTQESVNDLVLHLEEFHRDLEFSYTASRNGDIYNSVLSNDKVKDALDWSPMYSLRQGLKQTYDWALEEKLSQRKRAHQKPKSKYEPSKLYKPIQPYLENAFLYAIVCLFVLTEQFSMLSAVNVSIFYIVLIGIVYGNRQSFIAVALSVLLLTMEKLQTGREIISLLYDTSFFFQTSLFLFIGLVVGYTTQSKNNKLKEQKEKLLETEERYTFLYDIYSEMKEVKDELQLRVLNSGDSFGKVYSIIKELEWLEPEKVLNRTIHVIQMIMNVQNVSIYVMNKEQSFLRLVAHSNDDKMSVVKSLDVEKSEYVQYLMRKGNVFVNKELDVTLPLMATPLYFEGKLSAIITINDLKFDRFSLHYENLFMVTTQLVESALAKAFAYIEATEMSRYIPNTRILTKNVFFEILENKKEAQLKYKTPFLLLQGLLNEKPLSDYANQLSGLLRETDYIGQLEDDNFFVLLSNTDYVDGEAVLNRFEQHGIRLNWIEEGAV
ncbi:NAD-dependent epimerase/dehydratase family protein [Psychrobacillus sp. NPDC096623]|uniref:NAD-dependent epimerase/dehydratase family protein n=1 Tax=Psychrobacillus sp. NPDC096623 TaxID=3364492 RepID=UPI003811CEE4